MIMQYIQFIKEYRPAEIIFKVGEVGDKMYIVQDGTVAIEKQRGDYERSRQILFSGDTGGFPPPQNRISNAPMPGHYGFFTTPVPCLAILMRLECLSRYSRVHPFIHGKPLSRWSYRRGSMADSQ